MARPTHLPVCTEETKGHSCPPPPPLLDYRYLRIINMDIRDQIQLALTVLERISKDDVHDHNDCGYFAETPYCLCAQELAEQTIQQMKS